MKKIFVNEKQILKEEYYEAGTDFPSFHDKNTDTWYEASWNGDYAYPFGFWVDDYYGSHEVFSVGDAWTTHENACGKVAKSYFEDILYDKVNDDVTVILDKIEDIKFDISNFHCQYDDDSDSFIGDDGFEVDLWNEADEVTSELNVMNDYNNIHEILVDAIINNNEIDESDLIQETIDNIVDNQDFTCRDGIDRALELVGDNFNDFFERGNSEGRIWPNVGMIGFYVTEQPDPERLLYILGLLSKYDEIGVDYDDMLNFHMVFEDWRNDGEITCCTISDYVDGNYGPESYEDEDDEEVQYARQGKTVFIPHLANQKDKREFFKDFRNIRDKAIYVPREKAAGNLARYHAMRYPFGENKEGGKKVYINESVIDRVLLTEDKREKQKDNQCLNIIDKYFGYGSEESYQVLDNFKEFFYHGHNIRNTYMMALAPLFCNLSLKAGFGTAIEDSSRMNRLKDLFTAIADKLIIDIERRAIKDENGEVIVKEKPVEDKAVTAELQKWNLGMSYEELEGLVNLPIENEKEKEEKEKIEVEKHWNQDYLPVQGPLTFEEAREIGNYSSSDIHLCYTQGKSTWDSENFGDGGRNTAYCLLTKDWRDVPEVHDGSEKNNDMDELRSYNGYDRYGLSMIFVWVTPDGELYKSNTRWNHDAKFITGDVDKAFTKGMLEHIMGVPFESVFKPIDSFSSKIKTVLEEIEEDPSKFSYYFHTYSNNGCLRIIWARRGMSKYTIAKVSEDSDVNINLGNGEVTENIPEILFPNLWFDDIEPTVVESHDGFYKIYEAKIGNKTIWFSGDGKTGEVKFLSRKEFIDKIEEMFDTNNDNGLITYDRRIIERINDNYGISKSPIGNVIIDLNTNKSINPYLTFSRAYTLNNVALPKNILPVRIEKGGYFNLVEIDENGVGKLALPNAWFYRFDGINGNFITVSLDDGKKTFNLKTKKEVKYDDLTSFVEGLIANGEIPVKYFGQNRQVVPEGMDVTNLIGVITFGLKYNFVINGKIVFKENWFNEIVDIYYPERGFFVVRYEDETWNICGSDLKMWFDEVIRYISAYGFLKYDLLKIQKDNDGLEYVYDINKRCTIPSNQGFIEMELDGSAERLIVQAEDGKEYLMDFNGNLSQPFIAIRGLTTGLFKAIQMDDNSTYDRFVLIDRNGNIKLNYKFNGFGKYGDLLLLRKENGSTKIVIVNGDEIIENGIDEALTKECMTQIANDPSLYHLNHGRLDNEDDNLFWVELFTRYNILSKNDNRILFPNMWFDAINPFYGEDYNSYLVIRDNKYNLIKSDFEFLKPNGWFEDFAQKNHELFFYDNGHVYVTDYNGNILSRRTFDLSIENINTRLANGEKPEDIFDDIKNINGGVDYPRVEMGNDNYNILSREDNQLLGDRWYNTVRFISTPPLISNIVNDKYLFTVHVGYGDEYIFNYLKYDGSYVFPDFWIKNTWNYGSTTVIEKNNNKHVILKGDGYLFHQGCEFDKISFYDSHYAQAIINDVFYLLSIDTDKMAKFDDVEAYIASNNIRNADYKQITDIIGENKKLSSKKVYINESFINKMIKGGV